MSFKKNIELLAPAGSIEALDAAIGEGADAVYVGLYDFNARIRAKNFAYKQFEAAVENIHAMNKKIYVALNTVFEDRESDQIYNLLKYLSLVMPDGIIVQDIGIIRLVNEYFPNLKVHASVQMNITSAKAINFLSKFNVNRVILGRELSLDSIKAIRSLTNTELEIFVHGALCVTVSGLCLFSSYLGGKSANRGACTQPCRRLYESEKGKGYYFSTNDLMLIEHVPDLIEIGCNSLKIEGRMRSAEYVANVVRAYRHVIDNYKNDKGKAIQEGLAILKNDFAREKTKYYFINKTSSDLLSKDGMAGTGIYLGSIKNVRIIDEVKMGLIASRVKLAVSDTLRMHSQDDKRHSSFKIKKIIINDDGIYISIPEECKANDGIYLINTKESKKNYPYIIPKSLDKYKRHPGNSSAPSTHIKQKSAKDFNNGFYAKINNFKDLYVTQSIKPEKLIINFTKSNAREIKKNLKATIYKPEDIILNLMPYFSNYDEDWLQKEAPEFLEMNFKNYVLNNIGQISLFKQDEVNLIVGPYLYTFNKYSIDFLLNQKLHYFIPPIESSKKNIFATTEPFHKENWFITIFSYPELFFIRTDLTKKYSFNKFIDKANEFFILTKDDENTYVIPEKPFSITDKITELKKHGFNKYILDFSYIELKKSFYKNIMQLAQRREIITGTHRFNWKEGFYRMKEDK